MKYYIMMARFCSKKPKNDKDRLIKDFMKHDIVEVKRDRHHCSALNFKGQTLRWWSSNKYYGYGDKLRFEDLHVGTEYRNGYPSVYYTNLLANIEHGVFTVTREKTNLYECQKSSSHSLYEYRGRIWCSGCNKFYESYQLTKTKGILNE